MLLLSGDITQRATRAQFGAARAFVERLRVPAVVVIPGNHDIPLFNLATRLFTPYGHYERTFGRELEPRFEDDKVLVLALNTTRWYRHKDGAVSAAQIERVAQRLEKARSAQWRIVVVHQPVAVTRERDRGNVLHGHAAAVWCWAAAGTAVSDRVRADAGNSVNVIRVGGAARTSEDVDDAALRCCVVERWDHTAASQRFERVSVHPLRGAHGG